MTKSKTVNKVWVEFEQSIANFLRTVGFILSAVLKCVEMEVVEDSEQMLPLRCAHKEKTASN